MQFTKEIKEKWLTALKSGKYKQGFSVLENKDNDTFCCIDVLGDIISELDNDAEDDANESPYEFLNNTTGIDRTTKLWKTNDHIKYRTNPKYKRNYSNVISIIKQLKTVN